METVCYGIGGYLPDHPNSNVIERRMDNGDGTGTRTIYDASGNMTKYSVNNGDGTITHTFYDASGNVTDSIVEAGEPLPIIPPPIPDPAERIAALEATVDALLAIIEGA